jgi:subtilisin family serine protease
MSFLFSIIFSLNIFSFETERVKIFSNGNYQEVEAVKGEVIVRIPDNKKNEITEKLKTLGYEEIKQLYKDFYLAKNKNNVSLNYHLSSFSNDNIEFYPNTIYRPLFTSFNDPDLSKQWYLNKINLFYASDFEETKTTVTVAVVDTGVWYLHDDLKNVVMDTNTWTCFNYNDGSLTKPCVATSHWHGTAVSGVISAERNNLKGIAGISIARIYSANVFYNSPLEDPLSTVSTLISALSYISNTLIPQISGKLVINMSLGSDTNCEAPLQYVIDELYNKNVIIVAAAGNSYSQVLSPANCRNVVPVSATDESDKLAYFSNYGSAMLNGLSAPGVNIFTTTKDNGYEKCNGTSFSAPIVSGVMALVWAKRPELKNYEVIDIVRKTTRDVGDDGPDTKFGWGIVDAYKAVSFLEANLQTKGVNREILVYPNPFYPSRHKYVKFHIKNTEIYPGDHLMIYDFSGNFIAYVRYDGKDGFIWDGKNSSGADVDTGLYVVYYKNDKNTAKSKFLLVR